MRYTDEQVIFAYLDNDYHLTKTARDMGLGYKGIKKILDRHQIEIKKHGGNIRVESEINNGTTFFIQL